MKTAEVKIKGTKPLIWHAFNENVLSMDRKSISGKVGNNSEEWKDTVLVDNKKRLYVKDTYIFAALREGAKNIKIGRGTLKAKLISCLTVIDSKIYVINREMPKEKDLTKNSEDPVYLDICGVTNPNTKGKNIRYRIASSPGWEIIFVIRWDDRLISHDHMEQIVEAAGLYNGIGDGRNWGNGRFKIISYELI